MSGTASRNQTRLTYAPGLRVGAYPGQMPFTAAPPVPGVQQGPLPVPPVSTAPQARAVAAPPPEAPPVSSGSVLDRRRDPAQDSENNNGAQDTGATTGGYGVASTGSFMGDMSAIGGLAPGFAAGLAAPGGLVGLALGTIAAGAARAFGAKELANDIFGTLTGTDPSQGGIKGAADPASMGEPPGGFGDQTGTKPDALSLDAAVDGAGAGVGAGVGPDGNPTSGDFGGGGGFGGDFGGASASDAGGGVGPDGNPSSGDYMRGGYTGAGPNQRIEPHKIAGRVHEGEVVIPAGQVSRYGLDPLLMLARGQVEPSRLMALLRG